MYQLQDPYFMILNMIFLILLFICSLITPLIHVIFFDKGKECLQSILLKYSLFFNVGCLFLIGFIGHLIYPSEIAKCLEWNWSPFQYELSFSELALATLGLSCSLFNYQFWLATIICSSIWLLGAAGIHIYYNIIFNSSIIVAFVVYWNIFIAVWLIVLYYFYHKKMSFKLIDWLYQKLPQ